MSVRAATEADAHAIFDLVNLAYEVEASFVDGPRITLDEVRRAIRLDTVLVAEHEGRPAGVVHLSCEGRVGHFGMLAVEPPLQRSGLGGLLVDEAEQGLARAGVERIEIEVVNLRDVLVPWYATRGYRVVGTSPFVSFRPAKRPVHFIVMCKQIGFEHSKEEDTCQRASQ